MPVNTSTRKIFDIALLKRVLQYAGPYKRKFYLSVFLAVILAAITPVRPWLIQLTINRGIQGKTESAAPVLNRWLGALHLNNLADVLIAITIFQIGLLFIETSFI